MLLASADALHHHYCCSSSWAVSWLVNERGPEDDALLFPAACSSQQLSYELQRPSQATIRRKKAKALDSLAFGHLYQFDDGKEYTFVKTSAYAKTRTKLQQAVAARAVADCFPSPVFPLDALDP